MNRLIRLASTATVAFLCLGAFAGSDGNFENANEMTIHSESFEGGIEFSLRFEGTQNL